jgi:hypothetical protein
MRREDLGPAIAGGYVTKYNLDLCEKSFEAEVEVLTNGAMSHHGLRFSGVSAFDLRDDKANRWERIEVTDIRVDEGPEGSAREEWRVWINFWDAAELTIRCATIQVNGDALK